MSSKYHMLKQRLLASEALRLAKKFYTYRELSRITGLPESVLSRYIMGHTIPSIDQAQRIWSAIKRAIDPKRVVVDRIKELGGLIDLSPILSDPLYLRMISIYFYEKFSSDNITKIIVPEASGISLATALSMVFEVPMVIARRMKENPYEEYIEEAFVEPPSNYIVFYVPRKSIRRDDRFLVVDDIVQTGRTLGTVRRIVEKGGARIVGVAAIVVIGDEWKKRAGIERIEALVRIGKP